MPGFDGSGPMGRGPMSGGGFGYCAVDRGGAVRGMSPRGGGYGRGRGFGGGRGQGFAGGGRGRGFGRFGFAGQAARGYDEAQSLRDEASVLESELAAIKSRLADLEGK